MESTSDKPIDISRFIKVYSNLSIGERELAIAVIDEKPISWNLAYNEIKNRTPMGIKILKELTRLDII